MSIEQQLARIVELLETIAADNIPTATLEIIHEHPAEEAPTEEAPIPEPTLDEVRVAVTNFLPDRRDEAVKLMAKFGAEKIGDFKPDDYPEIVATFNAAFNS